MRLMPLVLFLYVSTPQAAVFNAFVVRVLDGDTIDVSKIPAKGVGHDSYQRIRFADIDAPEKAQPFGMQSRAILAAAIQGKQISVDVSARDKYGRYIGTVTVDGKNINRYMIETGSAWVYRQYCKDKVMFALELKARYGKAGLWAEKNPVPPWEFRHAS